MNSKTIAHCPERDQLAFFGTLAVADVKRSHGLGAKVTNGKGGANGRIHTPAEGNNNFDRSALHMAIRPRAGVHQKRTAMRRLYPFQGWLPDELVNLQTESRVHALRQNPFGQLLRINEAVRHIATSAGVLAKRRRKDNGCNSRCQSVLSCEV